MPSYDHVRLRNQISLDEGRSAKMYLDSEGILTFGVGCALTIVKVPVDARQAVEQMCTAAIPFSQAAIDAELDARIMVAEAGLRVLCPELDTLTPARQEVLINMAFNLGQSKLAKFVRMWEAVHAQQWEQAAIQMLDSLWARQVGERAARLAYHMREG